jgi:hypothetical protein
MPANVPCTLLCGETFGAIGVLPNCDPTKNPTTSDAMTQIATPSRRPTPSGSGASNRPANPPRPPTYANASRVVAMPNVGRPGVTSSRNHRNVETVTSANNTG